MKFNVSPERIWQSVFTQDVEYVRIDIAEQMVKAAREECAAICKRVAEIEASVDNEGGADIADHCADAIRETINGKS
jgi:hypothetical protein